MKLLLSLIFAVAMFAQGTTVNAPAVQLDAPSTTYLLNWMATIQKTGTTPTTLTAPIDAVTTTVQVADGQGLNAGSVLGIGTEHLTVVSKAGKTLTVTRSTNGTTAAAALAGAPVIEMRYRTVNAYAKDVIVQATQQIVRNERIKAAAAQAAADAEAAVTAGIQ